MKYLIPIFIFLTGMSTGLIAQQSDLSIPVSVGFQELSEELSSSHQEKLQNKVQQLLARNGVSAEGWAQDFVVYPKVDIYDSETIDGLQKLTVVKAEFSLYLKQAATDMVFASTSHSIKGSGSSMKQAITKAIGSIRSSDKRYTTFVEEGKTKILRYFNENCGQFINKSNTALQVQAYDKAFVELLKIPVQAESCYAQAQEQMLTVYQKWQANNCGKIVQQGKASIAAHRYGEALKYLASVDPDAPCFAEATQLIGTIKDKVDELELREWNFRQQQYNDAVALEKMRINAVVDIAQAYAKKEPDNLYYNLIVR